MTGAHLADMCAIREVRDDPHEIRPRAHTRRHYNTQGRAPVDRQRPLQWAWLLADPAGHIFGSHRSHGEILAKGLSSIRGFGDDDLEHVMRSYRDGASSPGGKAYSVPSASSRSAFSCTAPTARCSRASRLQPRLGSMHAFFTPLGLPQHAIVGAPVRCAWAALFKRINRRPASWWPTSRRLLQLRRCGRVSPSLMDQYRKLWTRPSVAPADRLQLHEQLLRMVASLRARRPACSPLPFRPGVNPSRCTRRRSTATTRSRHRCFRARARDLSEGRGPVL